LLEATAAAAAAAISLALLIRAAVNTRHQSVEFADNRGWTLTVVVIHRNSSTSLDVVTPAREYKSSQSFLGDLGGSLSSPHAGVARRRRQSDGTTAGARGVDVRLRRWRRRGDHAVCRWPRRGDGSHSCPSHTCRRPLFIDVGWSQQAATRDQWIRRRDAKTAVTSRYTSYVTAAG